MILLQQHVAAFKEAQSSVGDPGGHAALHFWRRDAVVAASCSHYRAVDFWRALPGVVRRAGG